MNPSPTVAVLGTGNHGGWHGSLADARGARVQISGGPADCGYAHLKGAQMMAGEFAPSFGLDGASKDLELITEAAGRAGVDITLLTALGALYRTASELGYGKHDIAAVIRTFDADLIGGPTS